MSDHALWQVQSAIVSLLSAEFDPGLVVTITHDRDLRIEPFDESELPGLLVRTTGADVAPNNYQSQSEWTASFFVDVVSGETSTLSIGRIAAQIGAEAHRILFADKTLGGLTQPLETQALGILEQEGSDTGLITMPVLVKFTTPRDDHTTIITN